MATRTERVRLELVDDFTTSMARAAAATAVLNKELKGLSGRAVESSRVSRSVNKDIDGMGKSASRAEKDIDKLSGRLRILADIGAIVGPSLAPIGAVGVAAIAGLTSQLGFAVLGAGTAVLAFQGVGDALKAVNKAALEPTTANLAAAREQLDRLSPAAQSLVEQLRSMTPEFQHLRDLAATGLFPGLVDGLDGLENALPRVEKVISAISTELGDIAREAGQSLGSERWAPFLDFVATEGPAALGDLAKAVGNTAHALAGLWMSTNPLNQSFSKWLVDATADLDKWANSLGETKGFTEFLNYVNETGPQVASTLGALANASLQIVEAAAPLGGPVLKGVESLANIVASIADSDLGTPIFIALGALAIMNRTLAITASLQAKTFGGPALAGIRSTGAGIRGLAADVAALNRAQSLGATPKGFIGPLTQAQTSRGNLNSTLATLGKTAAVVAALGVASSGAADGIGLTNTATGAMVGRIAGPWGAAIGGFLGLMKDAASVTNDWTASIERADRVLTSGSIDQKISELKRLRTELEGQLKLTPDGPTGQVTDLIGNFGAAPLAHYNAVSKKAGELELSIGRARAQAALDFEIKGLVPTADALERASRGADEFANSLLRAQGVLSKRSAARDYQAALDDFTKSVKENGKTLDINTEAGRANQGALDNIASAALKTAEAMGNPVLKEKFLDSARGEFIKAAMAAGQTRKQARALADQLGLINRTFKFKLVGDVDQAEEAAKRIAREIRNIPTRWQTDYFVNQVTGFNKTRNGGKDGDPDTPYAGGGYTGPGGRNQPAGIVHKGEVVWSQDDVAAYGGPMVVDAMRQGMPGYARGGTPGLNSFIRNDLDMKVPTTLKQWNEALAAGTKLLQKDKDARQLLLDQAAGVRSAIGSNYRSDIFASTPKSVWMSAADRAKAGTGDVFSTLTGDIGRANSLTDAEAKLKAKGLDSAAYADLVSNASLEQVQAFANGSKADVMRYEALYNQREKALVRAGNAGADAAFGPALALSRAEVAEVRLMRKEIERAREDIVKSLKAVGPRRAGRSG